jgi:magnesium transporter
MNLRAAALGSAKHCDHLGIEEAVEAVRSADRMVWVDVQTAASPEAHELLVERMGFHELAVEDALNEGERPSLQEQEDTLFLAVPALQNGRLGDPLVEVAFFLREKALVTVEAERVKVLNEWYDRWSRRPERLGHHPAYLLHALLDGVVDQYFPVLDELEEKIDDMGDALFEGDADNVKDLLQLKRQVLNIRRRLSPVREVLNSLLRRDLDLIPDDARVYFQDVYDHVARLLETADIHRDTVTSLLDVHLSTVSNNLNQVVKKMTVFSTVLMSMALVAGIYGMNFEHIPELHWRYGYLFSYVLMALVGGGVLGGFRIAKWI